MYSNRESNAPSSSQDSPTSVFASPSRRKLTTVVASVWSFTVELFRFLPIRLKLSLIIGSIVALVLTMLSLIVIQTQESAVLRQMNQVADALIRNLAETVKGDLLLANNDNVKEAVLRLNNTDIAGLKKVAVVNHKGEVVAGFAKGGERFELEDPKDLLRYRKFTIVDGGRRFHYFYPIVHESNPDVPILLGVAFISFSKRVVLAPVRLARNIALTSALLIVVFAFVGINMIAKRMTNQIRLLSDGARQVGNGNLNIEILVNSKDEFGRLANEFNNMIQQLREKLQMQKFVSQLTVEMIKDSAWMEGQKFIAAKRSLTVLFSDVRNFSSISEHLDPGDIVKLLNVYFDLQTRIIENHDGIVDKFMGDQIMAIFQGAEMADGALRAAVEIQKQIRLINQEREIVGHTILEVGIGINNGSAVIGNMGSSNRMDYTVIGDVVNVAARLCAHAKSGQIITSLEVAKQVTGSYPTSRLKSISVKGRSQAIKVCEVDYEGDILI